MARAAATRATSVIRRYLKDILSCVKVKKIAMKVMRIKRTTITNVRSGDMAAHLAWPASAAFGADRGKS